MAYTGRLANKDARLANFKLGHAALPVVILPGGLPDIDLPTRIAVALHSTALAVAPRRGFLNVAPRRTIATFD